MGRVLTDAQRERKRETDRLYREANREKYQEYYRLYNELHRDEMAASRCRFRERNPDYNREYYRRKVESTGRSVRPTRGRPRKSDAPLAGRAGLSPMEPIEILEPPAISNAPSENPKPPAISNAP